MSPTVLLISCVPVSTTSSIDHSFSSVLCVPRYLGRLTRTRQTFSIVIGVTSYRPLEPQCWRIGPRKWGALCTRTSRGWTSTLVTHPTELPLPEASTTYFSEESVRRVPGVDAPRRFDEAISYF
jgi:hypothetical protein